MMRNIQSHTIIPIWQQKKCSKKTPQSGSSSTCTETDCLRSRESNRENQRKNCRQSDDCHRAKNPNWEKNNRIAGEIIEIAEQKYPGFFFTKITYASEARYNQSLTDGALLFEVGSQLNTYEEAMASVEPLARVLKEYLEKMI
jgi:hypothetical protein